jgi:hypothetical protein
LKFIVRSESDGYLKEEAELDTRPKDVTATNTSQSKKNVVEAQGTIQADNSTLLETLTVTNKHPATDGPLHVEMRGRQIPQRAIFDLKTRVKETRRPIDIDEIYRKLWVNQTLYFIFVEHFRGSFEPRDV